jgi:uncharacterized membrane protein
MAFDLPTFARFIHVVSASLWAGGAFLMAFILGPSFRAAGPAAGPVMLTILRRGGLSPYFASIGGLTILSGLYIYYAFGYTSSPFGGPGATVLTLGIVAGVVAYGLALFVLMPIERKSRAIARGLVPGAPPSPEQAAELQALGMKQGKGSAVTAAILILALLLMTGQRLF